MHCHFDESTEVSEQKTIPFLHDWVCCVLRVIVFHISHPFSTTRPVLTRCAAYVLLGIRRIVRIGFSAMATKCTTSNRVRGGRVRCSSEAIRGSSSGLCWRWWTKSFHRCRRPAARADFLGGGPALAYNLQEVPSSCVLDGALVPTSHPESNSFRSLSKLRSWNVVQTG